MKKNKEQRTLNNEQRKIRRSASIVICYLLSVICYLVIVGCSDDPVVAAPPQANFYQVTVASYGAAGFSGGGSYEPGVSVSINAGTRDGYTFSGWSTASAGVFFVSAGSKSTSFIMPAGAVTVTANWDWDAGTVVNAYEGLPLSALVKDGRRPIPVSSTNGTGYDELLFYSRSSSVSPEKEVFDKNNQWRKDAWSRIGQIRKGDITVIVKDSSGNPVEGAQVKVSMYEHEFKWGTMVNGNVAVPAYNRYRAGVSLLFNTVVLENGHKWNFYEADVARTRDHYNAAKNLGIKYVRGHALLWDSANLYNGTGSNNSIPQRIYDWFRQDFENEPKTTLNKNNIMNEMQAHIARIAGSGADGYRDQVYVWDVLNEPLYNKSMRDRYGWDVWTSAFAWARQYAGQNTILFINETDIYGSVFSSANINELKEIIDVIGVGIFDGIGIQSHFFHKVLPQDFYNMLQDFADTYTGKIIEITEFDMGAELSTDREYEASFTRDIMIAVFSQQNTKAFVMWGFTSSSHWLGNAPIFDANYGLKESGKQYIDLVYNKWMTKENGSTGSDGTCTINGFYGDYDITVSANGKTKTLQSQCYKGNDNTIIVMFDE